MAQIEIIVDVPDKDCCDCRFYNDSYCECEAFDKSLSFNKENEYAVDRCAECIISENKLRDKNGKA